MSQAPLSPGAARAVLVLSSLKPAECCGGPWETHRKRVPRAPVQRSLEGSVPCMPVSGRFVSSGLSELSPPAPGLDFIQTKKGEDS